MPCEQSAENPAPSADAASRLFTVYQTTGDQEALTGAFLVALPQLLLVARRFAADEQDAQDLVQSTILTAIEQAHRYCTDQRLLPWLIGILTNHCRRRWRRHREVTCADGDQVVTGSEPAELVLRAEARTEIVRALARLPMPYQEVVRLHLLEGHAPRELAQLLSKPPATVRTQIARGLAMLRRQLPRGLGAGMLALYAALAASPHLRAQRAGSRLSWRSRPSGIAVGAGIAFAATLVLCLGAVLMAGDLQPGAAHADAVHRVSNSVAEADPDVRRKAATIAAGPGSIIVAVVEPDRSTPVADLPVWLRLGNDGSPLSPSHAAFAAGRTDALGVVRFGEVPEGLASIWFDDGRHRSLPLLVRSGEACQSQVPLETQALVRGMVRDRSGRAVAGAEVWLTSHAGAVGPGYLAGHAGPDGSFQVRALSDAWAAWARQPGVGSSRIFRPRYRGARVVVQFVVEERRGALAGDVTDADGKPLAGATVSVCPVVIVDEFYPAPARHVVTDASGHCAIDELPAERCLIVARAPGLAPAFVDAELGDDQINTLIFRLGPGAVLTGRVAQGGARPLRVEVLPKGVNLVLEEVIRFASTGAVDADGRYRIDHLPEGPAVAQLVAVDAPGCRLAAFAFEAVAGATVTWNPEVENTLAIRGRIVDERDVPRPGLRVSAVPPRFTWVHQRTVERVAWTDRDGAFVLPGVPDARLDLYVEEPTESDEPRPFAVSLATNLRPGPETHAFRLTDDQRDSAFLTGTVRDAEGMAIADVMIHVWRNRLNRDSGTLTDEQGVFRAGPFPPGSYHVTAMRSWHGNRVYLGEFALAADQVLDVGSIAMQEPGWIALEFAAGGLRPRHDRAWISNTQRWVIGGFPVPTGSEEAMTLRSWPMAPGRYQIYLSGWNYSFEATGVEARSGAVTRLVVTPVPAVPCEIAVRYADRDGRDVSCPPSRLEILDAGGRELDVRWLTGKEPVHRCGLAPGCYSVVVTSSLGPSVTTPLRVAPDGQGARLEITVR